MRRLNKRGFTMVELLATIVIIGILGTVGVVGVTKSIKSAKDRYYVAQNKLFISAAQTYFTDNKSRLPMKSGTFKQVTLETLTNSNYIEKMVDYNKSEYNKDSYVTVTKLGLNMYSYEGNLIDSKKTVQKYKESGENDAKVTFRIDGTIFSHTVTKYTNGKKDVYITINDDDGIAGYIISITKSNKTVNEMDYIEAGGATNASNRITISTDKYGDGEYRVKVKVYDKYNDQISYISGKVVVDTIAPTCKYKGASTNWQNTSRTITYTGEDKLSGLDKNTIKEISYGNGNSVVKTIKGEKYSIKDNAGNITVCDYTATDINIYYDKEGPECKYDGESTEWVQKRDIKVSGDDKGGVGCSDSKVISFTETAEKGNISNVVIKDKLGNATTCSKNELNVYVDSTPPKLENINNQLSDWQNKGFRMELIINPSKSGIEKIIRYEDNVEAATITSAASEDGGTNFSYYNYNITQYTTGTWEKEQDTYVCYKVIGRTGLTSNTKCTQVRIDTTPPELVTDVDSGFGGKHTATCTDKGGSGFSHIFFYANNGNGGGTSTDTTLTQYWTTNATKSPSYTCYDNAGNASKTLSYTANCSCYEKKDNKWVQSKKPGDTEINCKTHNMKVKCKEG